MNILGPIELLKESFQLFFQGKNLGYLIKVTLATLGVELLPLIATILPIVVVAGLAGSDKELGGASILLILFGVVGVVLTVAAFVWSQIVMVKAAQNVIQGQITGVGVLFRESWGGKIGQLFLLSILLGIIVSIGLILLIIPGVIFAVWFAFAVYILILENRGIMESLSRSKELVKGHFWTVFGYNLFFGIVMLIITGFLQMVVPFIGSLIVILFTPFYSLFPLLLYRELLKVSKAPK